MEKKFVILCCENIRPEIDAVLATGTMPLAAAESYPFHCGHVPSVWNTVKDQVGRLDAANATTCLCGCGCANTFDIPKEIRDKPSLVLAESGASLFLPEVLAGEFRRCGAYLVLPGWLMRWKQNAERDGLDRATARQMFGESLSAIVLLDTGIHPGIEPVLAEYAEFTGISARTLPVGLDHLRFRLEALYQKWKCGEEMAACKTTASAAEKRVADYSMVADLTGMIIGVHDQKTVILKMLDHFVQLCSPKRVAFLPARDEMNGTVISIPSGAYPEDQELPPFPEPEEQYRITDTGDGFRIRVQYNKDLIGVLSVEEVSLPSALDEYLNLAHFIVQIAGLSITIARTHANLMLALKTRENEIAERIRVELALRESEGKYRALVESSFDGIAIHQNGILVYVNQTAARLLGSEDPGVFIGKSALDMVAPEFRKRIAPRVEQAPERALELVREQFLRLDGTPIDVDVTTAPSIWEGKPAAYVTFRDITAQVHAENALRESEEKYRAIINDMQDIFYRTDLTGKITMLSPSAAKLAGYDSNDQLLGQDVTSVYADPAGRGSLLSALKEKGSVYAYPLDLRVRDGAIRHVTTSSHFYHDPQGNILGVEGVIHDITKQQQTEDALRESEERYRTIIENIQDVYFRFDRESRLVMVSPSAAPAFGFATAAEMLGRPALSLWKNPDARGQMIDTMRKLGGSVQDWEAEFVKSDTTTFWASVSGRLHTDEQGGYNGTEGIIRDISERKKMEVALKGALTKLNMLSSITRHDILNQITGLRTFLELSKEDLKGTKHEMFIDKEDQAAEAIQRQIEFTKYYQDIGVNAPKWQDAGTVIKEAAGQLSLPSIELQIDIRNVEIFADPLIVKVFFNLMENSLRHGERVTQISFSNGKSVEGLIITYRDNGAGISAEDKKKLFQRGFGKHTGLGLFLSREILAITGITITENGEPGKGVQFEITVPYGAFRFSS
ncbi:MAG: PAS domain S-box protein [Methanoregula sp.]|jgi:PAS domain S-box-containing protein